MPETSAATGQKLKVFISYSRRDLEFADQLAATLEWQGFQVIIDRKGIHGAENWEQRLGQLILECDTVVFVLSPDSAASDVCKWEVEEAARRAKRFVPIVCRALEGVHPHALLRDLNYIHFYAEKDVPGSGFGTGQIRLVEALKVDVAWLREPGTAQVAARGRRFPLRPGDLPTSEGIDGRQRCIGRTPPHSEGFGQRADRDTFGAVFFDGLRPVLAFDLALQPSNPHNGAAVLGRAGMRRTAD